MRGQAGSAAAEATCLFQFLLLFGAWFSCTGSGRSRLPRRSRCVWVCVCLSVFPTLAAVVSPSWFIVTRSAHTLESGPNIWPKLLATRSEQGLGLLQPPACAFTTRTGWLSHCRPDCRGHSSVCAGPGLSHSGVLQLTSNLPPQKVKAQNPLRSFKHRGEKRRARVVPS